MISCLGFLLSTLDSYHVLCSLCTLVHPSYFDPRLIGVLNISVRLLNPTFLARLGWLFNYLHPPYCYKPRSNLHCLFVVQIPAIFANGILQCSGILYRPL